MNGRVAIAEPHALERFQRPALFVGIAALAACAVGGFFAPVQFFHSYLFAFLFWAGIALGCMAVAMLHHVTGGAWGLPIRRPLESGTRTLPLMALLFLPIVAGARKLYEWADPAAVARDAALQHKSLYLNVPFFFGRAVLYFAAWLAFAYFLNRWSLQQDATGGRTINRRLQLLSSAGLVVYGLTVTFASIDWAMSLEPHWFSTMYGVLILGGQGLSAMAFLIAAVVWLSRRPPLDRIVAPSHFHDLGNLLLAFVMLWAYFSFSQYLIIWAGNLPLEISWYLHRSRTSWRVVAMGLIVFHFALPFVMLLSRTMKREAGAIVIVALWILVARVVDLFWLIAPEFHQDGISVSWLDVVLPLTLGAIWLGCFVWQLRGRPILPVHDPEFDETLGPIIERGAPPRTAH